jgi:hypothetical protein
MEVHLLMGITSAWSDQCEWKIGAFLDKAEADERCRHLNAELLQLRVHSDDSEHPGSILSMGVEGNRPLVLEAVRRMKLIDPLFPDWIDFNGARYLVESVPVIESVIESVEAL